MQRIPILLQKISGLADKKEHSVIEIDLMLDYTKVLYADLLEMREKISLNDSIKPATDKEQEKEKESTEDKQEQEKETAAATAVTEAEAELKPEATTPNIAEPENAEEEQVEDTEPDTAAPEIQQPAPKTNSKDIRQLIGINDKYQFISELFGNDKEQYDNMLDEINRMDSFENAKSKLQEQYNWDEENITVAMFYSTLSQFFSSI